MENNSVVDSAANVSDIAAETQPDKLVSSKAKEIVIALSGLSYAQSTKALEKAKVCLEDMPIKFESW